MTKNQKEKLRYQAFFSKCKKIIKFAPFLEELNIPKSNFSQFLNSSNLSAVSLTKLVLLFNRINKEISLIINTKL